MATAFRQSEIGLADALGSTSTLEELRDELQEWYDNLPENFQNGDKGDQLQEAISELDNVQDLELPDELQHVADNMLTVSYWKKGSSRSKRRDDACADLRAAQEFLEGLASDYRVKGADVSDELELTPEQAEVDISDREPITQAEFEAAADAAEQLAEEIGQVVDAAESAEFPGMYG